MVYFGKWVTTFRNNLLLSSSGHNGSAALKIQTAGLFEMSVHIPETIQLSCLDQVLPYTKNISLLL